jgi:hypothetical protein
VFNTSGGYGEMTGEASASSCGPVASHVLLRVVYCPAVCNTDPTNASCVDCAAGSNGMF